MRAVFQTGVVSACGTALGERAWCLAPVGGKPLIEYWLEWAAELHVEEVRVVLGDGADEVEAYCGDGSRWGLNIQYGFLKTIEDPDSYLRRAPDLWRDGLLYLCGPVFPHRLSQPPWPAPAGGGAYRLVAGARTACLLALPGTDVLSMLDAGCGADFRAWSELSLDPFLIRDVAAYFELNMSLVKGEGARYVSPGYLSHDGASIGYNVLIPPSVELRPPLTIGNDCRIHPMAVIGPNAVIGNHVIVDQQTELSDCVVLDGVYVGRNLEFRGKIVSGSRVISPDDGAAVEITEPWLLAQLDAPVRIGDVARALAGWAGAVVLMMVQGIPFALMYPAVRFFGIGGYHPSERLGPGGKPVRIPVWTVWKFQSRLGRAFTGLGLDLFPLIARAAFGRLWLCGQAPLHAERDASLRQRLSRYFPAALGYHTRRAARGDETVDPMECLYYERYRSLAEDGRILFQTLAGRFFDALAGDSAGLR